MTTPRNVREEIDQVLAYCQGPKPSREKLATGLRVLAQRVEGDNKAANKLVKELEKHMNGVGKVAYAEYWGPDWTAVVDTEYGALKLYHVYRGGVDIKKSGKGIGWIVSHK